MRNINVIKFIAIYDTQKFNGIYIETILNQCSESMRQVFGRKNGVRNPLRKKCIILKFNVNSLKFRQSISLNSAISIQLGPTKLSLYFYIEKNCLFLYIYPHF